MLHFNYSTRPYAALPGNSACDQVLAELRGYLPGYGKGASDIFTRLIDQLDFAKNNATRALAAADRNHSDNPTTHVYELVEFLRTIQSRT